jgi:hypothetical protein
VVLAENLEHNKKQCELYELIKIRSGKGESERRGFSFLSVQNIAPFYFKICMVTFKTSLESSDGHNDPA